MSGVLILGAAPVADAKLGLDPYELGIAEREAGRLRGLVERLSKQNLLYQLHLGGVSKLDLQETANEIERLLEILERGSSAYAVAEPPNASVREQLRVVNSAWSPLRRMAFASPYDYLRYSSDLMPAKSRIGDPLMIRGFDRRGQEMIAESTKLMELYQEACHEADGDLCELAANSGYFSMLAERVAKELVFIYAGLDAQQSIERLKESREAFETQLTSLAKSPVLAAAQNPERGAAAERVRTLWQAMQDDWSRLRFEVDLATEEHGDALDVPRMLGVQGKLVEEMERLRAALSRYAAAMQGP